MSHQEKIKRVFAFELFNNLTARVRLALDAKLSRRNLLLAVIIIIAIIAGNNWPEVLEWANSIVTLLT